MGINAPPLYDACLVGRWEEALSICNSNNDSTSDGSPGGNTLPTTCETNEDIIEEEEEEEEASKDEVASNTAVAEGVDNKEELELFAGENLRRALLNRGIVFEDPLAPKCDFCGGKCTVSIQKGMALLSAKGSTESKIMAKNPTCRVSSRRGVVQKHCQY